jgi:hypothetical protein
VIPSLPEVVRRLGIHAVLVPLLVAGVFTAIVLLVQSISQWLDDRNP